MIIIERVILVLVFIYTAADCGMYFIIRLDGIDNNVHDIIKCFTI